MDQCFSIDHSSFILDRQAVRLTVCGDERIQEKQDIKGFLKSEGVFWERITLESATDTDSVYCVSPRILRQHFDCSHFPRDSCSYEVRCFHL